MAKVLKHWACPQNRLVNNFKMSCERDWFVVSGPQHRKITLPHEKTISDGIPVGIPKPNPAWKIKGVSMYLNVPLLPAQQVRSLCCGFGEYC
jgi:hypothetical protein